MKILWQLVIITKNNAECKLLSFDREEFTRVINNWKDLEVLGETTLEIVGFDCCAARLGKEVYIKKEDIQYLSLELYDRCME